jgi:hypothetical protein
MGFLAPLMLVGVIALAVPIAIHLIGRRRARVVKFAALDFLMATRRRTARSFRLREKLLLLVRAIACAAVAIALAKPYASCARKGTHVTRGPQAAVLVIDDSFAAGYLTDTGTWLRSATDEARRILTQLGPEAEVAIVRASEGAEHPTELTRDHLRLRDQLIALEPSARPADTSRALARAAQLLSVSSHAKKTVYLISLLAKSGLHVDDPGWAPGALAPELIVVDVRPGGPTAALANRAIVGLRLVPAPGAGSRGVAIDAEIANFADAPTTVEASVTIGDRVVARGAVQLGAHERRTKTFLATLPPGTRSTDAIVALEPDALPIDDRRWIRASLRDEVRALLVDGDPRTVRHDDELFYLEAALRPGDREDSGTVLRAITAEELAGIEPAARGKAGAIELDELDVVILANVAALPRERVEALATWVRGGGGILVAVGDRFESGAYDRTMLPLLPQSLRDPIDTTWGSTADDRDSRALHLVKWEADHPIFAPFSKAAPELADAKFWKIALLGPTTDTSDRKVLARFTNGAAALVEATIGSGRTMVFTSTLDRDWNDLPIHPGFLPFMQQAVRHLARKHGAFASTEYLVGQSVTLPTGDLIKLEVRGPDSLGASYEGDRITNRATVKFTRAERPGSYRVIGTDLTNATRDRDELAFAVNLDPRGSELALAPPAMLPVSGAAGPVDPADATRRVELWHALAAALLLLLLVEGLLIQR